LTVPVTDTPSARTATQVGSDTTTLIHKPWSPSVPLPEPPDDEEDAAAEASEAEAKGDVVEQPKEEPPQFTDALAEKDEIDREESVGSDLIYTSSDHVDGFSNPASRCILKAPDIALCSITPASTPPI
jgi:hypothetical protein